MSELERLLDLAAAVAMGSEVDWDRIERQSADDRERSVVRELRLIANIAEVARNPSSKRTASRTEEDAAIAPPESWGHLRVLGRIGQGSFGAVYRAWDSKLERHVALKLVLPSGVSNAFDLSRALREARLLARVRHPNVVSVFGADCHDDRFGLWMELVNGLTLEELLKTHGTMSAREAMAIGVDLCHALAAVHRARLLHRDIKASNVMREDGGRIVLMDLGAGRRMPAVDEPVDPLAGTPLYLAPELLAGAKPSVASDIYSVGVLLYHLVSGRYPVTGTNRDEVARAHEGQARISLRDVRPDLPPAFIDTIDRALSPEPRLRYRTAGEFGSALAALAGVRYERDPRRRLDWRLGAGAVAVTAALLIGIAQVGRNAAEPEPETRVAATASAPASYHVLATFYAVRNGKNVRLTAGSRVAPGDHLFLALDVSRPVHVYVVNQDEAGAAYLLFPLPGNEPQNPVPLNAINRLPGFRKGEAHYWEVTTAGGREHFLVYVAPERLTDFEQLLAGLPRAEADRPVEAVELTARAVGVLRGVGGLAAGREQPAAASMIPGLADLKPLPETREAAAGVWARRISFENPRSP